MASLCPFALSWPSSNLPAGPQGLAQGLLQMQKRQVKTGYETQEQRVLGKGSSQEVRTRIFKKTHGERSRERLETKQLVNREQDWNASRWAGGQVSWQGGQQDLKSSHEKVRFILEPRGMTWSSHAWRDLCGPRWETDTWAGSQQCRDSFWGFLRVPSQGHENHFLWWFILCVNLTVPQGAQLVGQTSFWMFLWCCFWMRLTFKSMGLNKADCPP